VAIEFSFLVRPEARPEQNPVDAGQKSGSGKLNILIRPNDDYEN
jgi:hypothetical protein